MTLRRKRTRESRKKTGAARSAGPRASSAKPTRRSPARAAAGAGARAKQTTRRRTPTAESIARKIVRLTTKDPDRLQIEDLYSDECRSREPGRAEPIVGIEGLKAKLEWWRSIQEGQTWKARHVFVKGHTICIEWEARIQLKDGRTIQLEEVAVHEVRGGKIVEERFYHDPSVLAPPEEEGSRERRTSPVPAEVPPHIPPAGSPPLDPMDA